jgi:WD40 repeat protein
LKRSALSASHSTIEADLDWIVMKCLEKDRARRYETANGLAADLRRHLNNEPVVARPPSAAYRFQKAWKRNKLVFAAGTAVALALVVGVIGTTAGLVRAERQRRAALAAQQEESRQREIAVKALDGEKAQRAQADAAREELQSTAYANAINLAQKAVADQNLGQAWDLLDGQRPAPGRPDRRGWEWRYLWQQCQSDALSSPLVLPHRYRNLSVSPDGKLLVATINGGSALLEISEPHQLRVIEPVVGSNEFDKAAFSPDSGLLAVTKRIHVPDPANDGHILRLLDTRTWKTVAETSLAEWASGLFFASDGKTLLSVLPYANATEQLALWRVPTLERIANSPGFRVPSGGLRDGAMEWGGDIAAPADLSAIAVLGKGQNPGVRVVDTSTGKELWHVGGTSFIGQQFSPDGRHLLISEGMAVAPRVRIFDARSGQELGPGLTEHLEWVSSLVFWPDGKTLATASADQTIRLWDLSDPARPKAIGRPLQGHKAEVWGLALLPDERTLVSTDKEGTFLAWDTQRARTDRTRLTLTSANGWEAYRFGPDGKTIFAVDGKGAVVRFSGGDFEVRDEVANLGKPSLGVVLSRDCRFLACGSMNGLVQLWDLSRRTRVKEFSTGSSLVMPFEFRGGGQSLIVFSANDLPTREWDLTTFKELGSWQDLRGPSCLSPDERWFFTFGEGEDINSFLSRDMVTGLRTVQTNTPSKVENLTHLAISPDGNLLVASSEKGYARILDRATLRPLGTLSGFLVQAVFSSCFSPDGKRLATASGGREALRVWDVARRDVARHQLLVALTANQQSVFREVQFSPDGNIIGALTGRGNSIHLWRAPPWAEIEQTESAAGKPRNP